MSQAPVLKWTRRNSGREPLPAAPFQIGPYHVDPRALLITDGVNPQRVERKVMEVLLCLVNRQGETVAHETLFEEAWQDNFVSDSVLHRAISVLRAVFGDNPRNPQYIETIPRVGYRLLQPVEWQEPTQRPDLLQHRRSVVRWRLLAIVAAGGALAAAIAAVIIVRQHPTSIAEVAVRPVTALIGYEFDPAISADGRWLTYVHFHDDHRGGLYVTSADDASDPRLLAPIVQDERYPRTPAWSPDGNQLAWIETSQITSLADADCQVQIQPLAAEAPTHTYRCNHSTSLDWSPDGTRLLINGADADGRMRLREIDIANRESNWLSDPPIDYKDQTARYSPDGRRIALVRTEPGTRSLIVVLGEAGREVIYHEPATGFVRGVDWWSDDELILSIDSGYAVGALWRLRLSDERLHRIPETYGGHSPAVAGDRIIYSREDFDSEIWAYNLESELGGDNHFVPHTESTRLDTLPQVSPDGATIAFVSDRSGSPQVWRSGAEGRDRALTDLDVHWLGPPRWNADGSSLLFESHSDEGFKAHVVNLTSKEVEAVELPFDVIRDPAWAPDGRMMISSPVDGTWQLWIREDSGTWNQFTDNGGLVSAPGPDGDWVYYTKYDRSGLWRKPLDGGDEEVVVDWLTFADRRNWALTRDAIIAVRTLPEGRRLMRVSEGGAESLVDVDEILIYGVTATDAIACYGRTQFTGSDLYSLQVAAG